MSEVFKILNNICIFCVQVRECIFEMLEEMLEKLEVVVNERCEEESVVVVEVEECICKLQ